MLPWRYRISRWERRPVGGVHRPPMLALFSENKCENERIGSYCVGVGWGVVCGACQQHPMDPPMNDITKLPGSLCCLHDSFVTSSLWLLAKPIILIRVVWNQYHDVMQVWYFVNCICETNGHCDPIVECVLKTVTFQLVRYVSNKIDNRTVISRAKRFNPISENLTSCVLHITQDNRLLLVWHAHSICSIYYCVVM